MSLDPNSLVGTLRDKIRQATKSSDQKLLEKYEVVHPDTNQLSKEGRAMFDQFAWDNGTVEGARAYILEQLQAIEDENDKTAKKAAKAAK